MRTDFSKLLSAILLLTLLAARDSTAASPKKELESARALPHAARLKSYKEISHRNVDSGAVLRSLYDEMKHLESEEKKSKMPGQLLDLQEPLSDAVEHSTNPAAQTVIVELLKEESSKSLRNMLSHKGELRAGRVRSLIYSTGRARNEAALPTLRRIRKDGGSTGKAAETAIGQIGKAEDLEEFLKEIKREPNSNINLDGFGEMALDRIMRDLNDPSLPDHQKIKIVGRLPRLSSASGINSYRPLLKHKDSRVVEVAARQIADMLQPGDFEIVRELLANPDSAIHGPTLVTLGRLIRGNPRLISLAIDALTSDNHDHHRAAAATLLGHNNIKSAEAVLREAAKSDPDPTVRKAAAGALKNLQN